jgi:drug/metabolite transporter (DMT)-like permease
MNDQQRGILLILFSYACLVGEGAAVHQLGSDVTALQCAFIRSAGSLVLVCILSRSVGFAVFRTGNIGLQFVRGGLTVVSIWGIFYGFAVLPLADATAITYTRAIFLTILAAIVLGERLDSSRWIATIVGVVGCLIIIRPGFESWRPEYLIVLGAAALNAGAMVATKILERRDTALTVMAYMTVISLAFSTPAVFSPWPDVYKWPWLIMIGILGPAALYYGLLAIRAAEVSVLAPFDYVRLIMAALLGFAFFGESPSPMDFLGAATITAVCVWVSRVAKRERVLETT